MDARTPRDGKSIEEIGTYDPMIRDKDKRVSLRGERVDYWLGVGALPTEKVKALIDKFKGKVPEKRIDERVTRSIPEAIAPVERKLRKRPAPEAAPAPEAEAAPSESAAATEPGQEVPAEAAAPPAEAAAEAPASEG